MTSMIFPASRPVRRWVCMASLTLALNGCSLLSRPTPPTVYRLPPPAAAVSTQHASTANWSLQIATPLAPASINQNAITVLPQPDQINSYRGARWSDPAPVLFRDALVRQLQQTHPAAVISNDDSEVTTQFRLTGRLDAFQSEYRDGRPQVVIHYDAQLLASDSQQAIAVRSFEIRLSPASPQVPAVVACFGEAVQQLDAQIQPWLSAALTTQTTPQAPASAAR
ncbi:ABC-type transport auxiliary lipoprotein family protein [Frateuria aurantia]